MDKQKSEGLVSGAVDFGMTAFDVRFRLAAVSRRGPLNVCCAPQSSHPAAH
ncbi:hypothetical protein J2W35_005233 [Variovorax boronicumulans]|uniref:hypothetical protein n=1 Tax=Variovorax boronicumulans TaxID=436515 RepID=UPI0027828DCC|nr:hypothetical protein [Variovorax boronicumulans]MDQ0084859.1 hypothetical protein [Variovorax boronicumulans]